MSRFSPLLSDQLAPSDDSLTRQPNPAFASTLHQGAGVGTALVREAIRRTEEAGLPFVKVATTNDDIPSLYFYQRLGFVIYDVDCGTVVDHHGEVLSGFAGIPIRDEIRLRRSACSQ